MIRIEPSCTPLSFFPLAIQIFPATEILSFLFDKHKLIGLNKWVKNSILNNLYNKTGQNIMLKTFLIPKHTTAVNIVCWIIQSCVSYPSYAESHAVTCTEPNFSFICINCPSFPLITIIISPFTITNASWEPFQCILSTYKLPFSGPNFVSLYTYMHPFILAQPQLWHDSPYPYICITFVHLHTSLQGIISHKTFTFIVTAVRTSLILSVFVHNFNISNNEFNMWQLLWD